MAATARRAASADSTTVIRKLLQLASSSRFTSTGLFQDGHTTGALGLSFSAISCGMNVSTSLGACSPSSSSQSKPATPSTSVVIGLASEHQQPDQSPGGPEVGAKAIREGAIGRRQRQMLKGAEIAKDSDAGL